ncbi:ribonuclease HIII [candidate division GN15 bacterium]|nr:ribonuclease HIII [candidate division GN15 bacterium]
MLPVTQSPRIIGVDESGKGDFFGPLVVAACLASDDRLAAMQELGVRDSKKIAPKKLLGIDEVLRANFIHAIIVVPPAEYNERYERIRNLNKLLAECHARAIGGVLKQAPADLAVSDKFGNDERLTTAMVEAKCELPLKQLVRGEAVPQVAAGSIIARAEFVRQMQALSDQYGVELPKGAAPQVDAAGRKIVAAYGPEVLAKVAKVHFKNYRRSLKPDLFSG